MIKQVLVVGCSSWLGSNFITNCPQHFEIKCLDRGESKKLNYQTYEELNDNPDYVVVFAVDYCKNNIAEGMHFNINIIGEVISFYLKKSKIIYVSSFFAKDLNNTDNLAYSASKSLIENRFKENPNFLSVRLEHVYGWNDVSEKLVPFVVSRSKANKNVIIKSQGIQRDFVWYLDVIEGIVKLIDTCFEISGIVEFGSGRCLPVAEVMEKIAKKVNKSILIKHLPSNSKIIESKSTTFLEDFLGRPLTSIDESLDILLK